jgi:hypothetical protein
MPYVTTQGKKVKLSHYRPGQTLTANSHMPCRAHVVLRLCHAVSFVKVRVAAGIIRTDNPTV